MIDTKANPPSNRKDAGQTFQTDELFARINLCDVNHENVADLLAGTIRAALDYCGADHGCILLKDLQGKLSCAAAATPNGSVADAPAFSESVVRNALQSGDTVLLDTAPDLEAKWALCAPIKCGGIVSGVIYLDGSEKDLHDRTHADLITFLAGHAALAMETLRLRKACEENKRLVAAGKATLNLSHSVKNILQMVSGAAEVVDFGLRSNEIHRVKRSWDILKPNLDRMKKYTLEMLDYSKERPLRLGPCDFNRVIQSAIESLKSQLKTKNSKLNIRVDQRIPVVILDGERIHEMALNLILNAIDVVDTNTGLVSVETRYDAQRGVVALSITDNGPGISDDMKEKIFTPFESDKKSFGTGLGMPIAKQIIDQHHGTIEVESQSFRGTTFTITFPANVPPAGA